ncbi:hypothetical protein Ancab_025595 [Ancistrocladus abbreviatus]
MGSKSFFWSLRKNRFTFGIIALTISDRCASIMPVRGLSRRPAFNPVPNTFMGLSSDDYVLVEKLCLQEYKFSHGDVIVFSSPSNHKEKHVKRIIAFPGDWVRVSYSYDTVKIQLLAWIHDLLAQYLLV